MDAYRVQNGNETLIAVRGSSTCFCGATGNCEFCVYRSHRGKYKIILHADMVNNFCFLKDRTDGYRDLVLWSHDSAFSVSGTTLSIRRERTKEACGWEEEYIGHELPGGGWVWNPKPRINSKYLCLDQATELNFSRNLALTA